MIVATRHHRLELPASLREKLYGFRRRVWAIKVIEAGCGAAFGIGIAFLALFCMDRLWETPAGVRWGLFIAAALACGLLPFALHRWVWRHRRLEQLARLLSRRHPNIGDQLLGIIELVQNESEQKRSMELCEAAVGQVSEEAESREFSDSVPNPRHRLFGGLALGAAAITLVLLGLFPAATANAWQRFLTPWNDVPRYTFTKVEPVPDKIIIAHGEPYALTVKLTDETEAHPYEGRAIIGIQQPIVASLENGKYHFEIPPQIDSAELDLRLGDYIQRIRLEPIMRPEVTAAMAEIELPSYLLRPSAETKDIRGGSVSMVHGSRAKIAVTATRELEEAKIDGLPVEPTGAEIISPEAEVKESRRVSFEWKDKFELEGKEPFVVAINGREDETPSVTSEGLPTRKVILDLEQLDFNVIAIDDYGVKRVGIEWKGLDDKNYENPAAGERILSAGGPEKERLELKGTFSAANLGIEPQPIYVRLFTEDYFPGRERVYSPAFLLYVLSPEQHAIWLAEQLSKWHRRSLDVRDREMQLYETNKQLRDMTAAELDQPETRRKIENQASAERANARRLSALVRSGESLVKQAMRNPEFGVGHLEKWAEMLQILKDISASRMPSVADLLKQASQAPVLAKNSTSNPRSVGENRAPGGGNSSAGSKEKAQNENVVPSISDVESTQQPMDDEGNDSPPSDSSGTPTFGLPSTMLQGGAGKGDASCPTDEKLEEAVAQQQDLLAEFDKVADELNKLLANLEGSTLVKRLKAASRLQNRIAGRLTDQVSDAFGASTASADDDQKELFKQLEEQEEKSSQDVSYIMDDMQAYFERRRFVQFKTVLDDMRAQDVVGGLRQLGDDLHKENGLSISQCEYWSDNLDRWAEDLVDPASGGT